MVGTTKVEGESWVVSARMNTAGGRHGGIVGPSPGMDFLDHLPLLAIHNVILTIGTRNVDPPAVGCAFIFLRMGANVDSSSNRE